MSEVWGPSPLLLHRTEAWEGLSLLACTLQLGMTLYQFSPLQRGTCDQLLAPGQATPQRFRYFITPTNRDTLGLCFLQRSSEWTQPGSPSAIQTLQLVSGQVVVACSCC